MFPVGNLLTFSFQKMTEFIFTCTDKETFEFMFTITKSNPRRFTPFPGITEGLLCFIDNRIS